MGLVEPHGGLDGEHGPGRGWRTAGRLRARLLDTGSIAFALECHVLSSDKVRVTARNVSASTVDLAAVPLAVQVVKGWVA